MLHYHIVVHHIGLDCCNCSLLSSHWLDGMTCHGQLHIFTTAVLLPILVLVLVLLVFVFLVLLSCMLASSQ